VHTISHGNAVGVSLTAVARAMFHDNAADFVIRQKFSMTRVPQGRM
jgi:hypothetical protein